MQKSGRYYTYSLFKQVPQNQTFPWAGPKQYIKQQSVKGYIGAEAPKITNCRTPPWNPRNGWKNCLKTISRRKKWAEKPQTTKRCFGNKWHLSGVNKIDFTYLKTDVSLMQS